MNRYIALLRGLNVGGSGKITMAELRSLCESLGFCNVSTYIQSGNVLFETGESSEAATHLLSAAIAERLEKPVAVTLRQHEDLANLLTNSPFPEEPGNRVVVVFYDTPLPQDALASVVPRGGEQLVLAGRDLYVHYPGGQGSSRLKLPAASLGTARNMNTVAKLAALSADG